MANAIKKFPHAFYLRMEELYLRLSAFFLPYPKRFTLKKAKEMSDFALPYRKLFFQETFFSIFLRNRCHKEPARQIDE